MADACTLVRTAIATALSHNEGIPPADKVCHCVLVIPSWSRCPRLYDSHYPHRGSTYGHRLLSLHCPPLHRFRAPTQFLVNRKEFIQELALAQSVREPKTTIPALSCLMLRADMSGHLSIVGTDLDHALFTSCSARVVSGGSLLLPARKLFDYVRLLEGDECCLHAARQQTGSRFAAAGRRPRWSA